ncbi:MAG: bifunctional oligoribonuclease/PAP phosphatase NrnA [Bacillota bacterium]|nr:MAG: bifunctional oligoribonuclease/PAP phosphatase NrnA [Bacillota bacterium]
MSQGSHSAADVARAIQGRHNFLLVLHEFADGDSVGSNLAMGRALREASKHATIASPAHAPGRYSFLPGFEAITDLSRLPQRVADYDCVLLIDCSDARRAGLQPDDLDRVPLIINIDHHPSNTLFGHVNYVDAHGSSAAEQVRRVIAGMGVPLDREMALCLYVAVSTDTGGFRFDNTTAETHLLAAELLGLGVEPGPVGEIIHDTRTLSSLRLLEKMLGTLSFAMGGRIAWVTVTRKMLEECGATDDEVEGLVSYPRMIDFVDLCFLLQEMPDGLVRVAFRSKRDIDVGAIAESLGGGGHRKAAGCILPGPVDEALSRVLAKSNKTLDRAGGCP